MEKENHIDKVRASRDGHEYHEIWTARKALQLLLPTYDLAGIAVEGLSPADQKGAMQEAVEIADITLYHGQKSRFQDADSVKVVQFKYSISRSEKDFRASDAKKTITKFAMAFEDHRNRNNTGSVLKKLSFQLITNRPIYPELKEAINRIANEKPMSGDVKKQAEQFKKASNLEGDELVEFADRCQITGLSDSLKGTKSELSKTLVNWTGANDAIARARLGSMKQMVRNKAGHAGTKKNIIRRVDILAALEIADIEELFPCPSNLPKVDEIVEREQFDKAVKLIPDLKKPLIVHADGGVGKTVFLDCLAKSIADDHEVIFFDCFGGGSYRAPEDSRHLPNRGLVHIINTLACRGLCDPLLPHNNSTELLFSTFRRRLKQCTNTISRVYKDRKLVLFLDAIDNAAEHANDRDEPSFPTELLKSFHHNGAIPGVKLVASCRSYRKDISINDVSYVDLKLEPFSLSETEKYLQKNIDDVSQIEIQVAYARSNGNPRILEHLVNSERGLLDESEIDNTIALNELIEKRIQNALKDAKTRGYKKESINAFLAGLSELPPPVPIEEYAGAHDMDVSAIQSFAADLAPLLERTRHGLMFRDEPTETFIRETYGSDKNALRKLSRNLLDRQDKSVYAARALPNLLQKLKDGENLFELAFDERFPEKITSEVGKRNIRKARLKAAVLHFANESDYNKLVHLLVELSTIAAMDQRGIEYILNHPDLVVAAKDLDATRRLFETKTKWPGTRHARLAITNTLSTDFEEANRHGKSAEEWILHYYQKEREERHTDGQPEKLDIAAIPFCLICQNRFKDAINFLQGWKQWYGYEVGELVFSLLNQVNQDSIHIEVDLQGFLSCLKDEIGLITSALSYLELSDSERAKLIKKLAQACKKSGDLDFDDRFHSQSSYNLQKGLLKAGALANLLNLKKDTEVICDIIPAKKPDTSLFSSFNAESYIFPYLVKQCLKRAIKREELRLKDILPSDLAAIYSRLEINEDENSAELKKKLKEELNDISKGDQESDNKPEISYEDKRRAEKFINKRIDPLFDLSNAFIALLKADQDQINEAFINYVNKWVNIRDKDAPVTDKRFSQFFRDLGQQLSIFAIWLRSDIAKKAVNHFLERLVEQKIISTSTLIKLVSILSKREELTELAGEQAIRTRKRIQNENDVIQKASLLGDLGRAILSAGVTEAAAYFEFGLEQMDSIGSGDHKFTNELLIFAASMKGEELDEKDFHTLTNICELNMPHEEEKFPWTSFAKGLAQVSGIKALAKLSRWDDRNKITLDYTLLPYLTALIQVDKISPEYALSLNRLADPVELHSCDTKDFAEALELKIDSNQEILLKELIHQYEENNRGILFSRTVDKLSAIAKDNFGDKSKIATHLSKASKHYEKVREERNEHRNYHGSSSTSHLSGKSNNKRNDGTAKLKELLRKTTPTDKDEIEKAVDDLEEQFNNAFKQQKKLFKGLRRKISYANRSKYIKTVSRIENINLYFKLNELEECKEEWQTSSGAVKSAINEVGIFLLKLHGDEFVSFERLSGNKLNRLSDLTEISITTLSLELIKIFALPEISTHSSVWLSLASFMCDEANPGEGQIAISRLLNSESAKLSSKVVDGKWQENLYPNANLTEVSAGFVWRLLGSPKASNRWQAAHCIRRFAKLGEWDVIDTLIEKYSSEDAIPFQAPELKFYFLHAQLWLLISLSRIALDHPEKIANYRKFLERIALNDEVPHVLIRHFASKAILTCLDKGSLVISQGKEKQIKKINTSPFPILEEKSRGFDEGIYQKRPKDAPEPQNEFYLDIDFQKYHVKPLARVFGKPVWLIKDCISEVVNEFDSDIDSMYDNGERETRQRRYSRMTHEYHGYGQYLGWHSLFVVAELLLANFPITNDQIYKHPWDEWVNTWYLTREDGLWLSDGMDRPPLQVKTNLLEKGKNGLVLTGNKSKVQNLVGINEAIEENLVISGMWNSYDDINVYISSALVDPKIANSMANELVETSPTEVWLPVFERYEGEDEFLRNKKTKYTPWIVRKRKEAKLDEYDPLGAICAEKRHYFSQDIQSEFSLNPTGPFKRIWKDSDQSEIAYSEAWGYENHYNSERSDTGVRLSCKTTFLKEVLQKKNLNLLILIRLQRYQKGIGRESSKFSDTFAVVGVNRFLDHEYYEGAINQTRKV